MILIYSTSIDDSTCKVMDWLSFMGKQTCRINDGNISEELFAIEVTQDSFDVAYAPFDQCVSRIWYRRTGSPKLPELPDNIDPNLRFSIEQHLRLELRALKEVFYNVNDDRIWLSGPSTASVDKIKVLKMAGKLGLNIPATIVSNNRRAVLSFAKRHGELIVKNIGYTVPFKIDDKIYSTYTSRVSEKLINSYPQQFFPCTFQQFIDKDFDIRTFYIEKRFFSMAIFSQDNEFTQTDFRRYSDKPNRKVPYRLPASIESKVIELMECFDLNTGSLDFAFCDGVFYFLEINPVGQFGMVSEPCNYYLEREIAKFLSKN